MRLRKSKFITLFCVHAPHSFCLCAFSAKIRVLEESYEILFALDKTGKDSKILEEEFKKVLNIATSVLEETKAIQEDLRTIN